jgi:primosomal protein N' (replication factor Y)
MIQLSVRVIRVPAPRFARFAIALPLYRVFEYALPDEQPVVPGTRYRLPFTSGTRTGILLESSNASDYEPAKIKPVKERIDQQPVLDAHMLALARWMSDYYLQPIGEVVFQCLPGYLRGARESVSTRVKCWRLVSADAETIENLRSRSPRQFEICQALLARPAGLNAHELRQINPNWSPVVKALEQKQILSWEWMARRDDPPQDACLPDLSAEQQGVLGEIEPRLQGFAVHLLDGITGSGKTEIYLRNRDLPANDPVTSRCGPAGYLPGSRNRPHQPVDRTR